MATLKRKTNNGYEPLPAMVVRKTNAENGNGIGTCSTSSGTALTVSLTGYELVTNGFVAVTFSNDVPASATLNINSKGAKPIIYKGSAITADIIKADDTVMFAYDGTNYVVTSLGGEGGSVTLVEYLSINLTCNDQSAASGLVGATVVVTDDDNSETILSTTWQGTTLECTIDVSINYTITVGSVADYNTPSSRTFKARAGYTRIENFEYTYYSDAVNLGLPSGLLWCTHNIGATNSWDIGLYFSYGNTEGHEKTSGYNFNETNYNSSQGKALSGDIPAGSSTYDAARVNMGSPWKMPSKSEAEELITYTDHEWVSNYNGVSGMKYMKKTDHNVFIFIPVGGRATDTSFYETTTVYVRVRDRYNSESYVLKATSSTTSSDNWPRDNGFPIRAIM